MRSNSDCFREQAGRAFQGGNWLTRSRPNPLRCLLGLKFSGKIRLDKCRAGVDVDLAPAFAKATARQAVM